MKTISALLIGSLAAFATAVPTANIKHFPKRNGTTVTVTQEQLLQIAPTAGCCKTAPFPAECVTAKDAVSPLNNAFATYQITSKAEAAAIIATQVFESVNWTYNINHNPGTPGQGTKNMQMINFNFKYAQSIDAIKSQFATIAANATDPSTFTTEQKNQTLALLNGNNDYSFGSGAWFLTTQCDSSVRSALQTGSDDGFDGFVTTCIDTQKDDSRTAAWTAAKKALGVTST